MNRLRTLALLAALAAPAAFGGVASAQNAAAETPAATPAAEPAKVVDTFEASTDLEAMRYRHLWIAYSAIWLLVFGFMFRTYKNSQQTTAELEVLKRRLAELEGKGAPDGH